MSQSSPEAEFEALLREDVARVKQREAAAFDELTGALNETLVLYGAGNLGRKTLAGLRKNGIEPVAFADGNEANWGKDIDGLHVISPQHAAYRYGAGAAFVVTIWSPGATSRFSYVRQQLQDLGCKTVVSFVPLFWKYAQDLLPHYRLDLPHKICERASDIRAAFALYTDEASKREFVGQLKWLMSMMDFDGLPAPATEQTYLPLDALALTAREHFVDCGAFDGDTIKAFFDAGIGIDGHVTAFEPDPGNHEKLLDYVAGLPCDLRERISVSPYAVGAKREKLYFDAIGTVGSAISGTGTLEVQCVPLDEVLDGAAPTYIKMDIEGAELDAIEGGKASIARHVPALAICVYHRQDHLWRIPLCIQSLSPEYRFFLRRYGDEFGDVVCYAAPEQRMK